jgi:hypothetical protein
MARASVSKVMASLVVVSCLSLPAMAQEPDSVPAEEELTECFFGPYLMTGAVLTGGTDIADPNDTLPELPTIEDDGR